MKITYDKADNPLERATRQLVRAYRTALGAAFSITMLGVGITALHSHFLNKGLEGKVEEVQEEVQSLKDSLPGLVRDEVGKYEPIELDHPEYGRSRLSMGDMPEQVAYIFSLAPELELVLNAQKDNNRLKAYFRDGSSMEYRAIFGPNPLPKSKEGDKATPEGFYKIIRAEDHPSNPLYGCKKLLLNYPNTRDLLLNRDGNGIVICGTDISERRNALEEGKNLTNGSIVLRNKDMEELYDMALAWRTGVLIE